jgi:hypothetical protein
MGLVEDLEVRRRRRPVTNHPAVTIFSPEDGAPFL